MIKRSSEFDGPEMGQIQGCKIDWKSGKNTSVKIIKQKVKQKGKAKVVLSLLLKKRKEKVSIFQTPEKVPEDPKDEVDDEKQAPR